MISVDCMLLGSRVKGQRVIIKEKKREMKFKANCRDLTNALPWESEDCLKGHCHLFLVSPRIAKTRICIDGDIKIMVQFY